MRVVVAVDSFGGTLTATEAAAAVAEGWLSVAPHDLLDLAPVSDGGPGFVDVLTASLPGEILSRAVRGPAGTATATRTLVHDGVAYVESAQACGLHLLAPEQRDPRRTTTYGVGELLAAARDAGARRVVVGLGGSGTNDGGAGAWAALGARADGELAAGGAPLLDLRDLRAPDAGVDLVVATDVDNPLLGPQGASAVFGPQKGADRAAVLDLDDALRRWADLVELATGRPGIRDAPGAGAAGGLGFGLLALGASRAGGFALVAEATGLPERVAAADLVVAGEGAVDATSLRGKAAIGVAGLAQRVAVPCIVVAGRVEVGRRDAAAAGIDAAYSVTDITGSPAAALAAGAEGVAAAAAAAARAWSRSR
ncbi:MAG TPA: glycerate kinase [Mycobacteriales bacterium]|nr:glycerate kinase [Mycobacteriales bacterium]